VDLDVQEGVLTLKGQIDFDNVVNALKKSVDLLQSLPDMTIDLQNLTQSDSSGLALLLAWMRTARQQKKKIVFLNMPPFLTDLAMVSGLSELLGAS